MTPEFLVVVLNGPQRCGKDTIARRLVLESHPFKLLDMRHVIMWQEKMITPVRDIVREICGLSDYEFEVCKDDPIIQCKDDGFISNKVTPREAVINVDKMFRQIFGPTYLAHMLIRDINRSKSRGHYFLYDDPFQIYLVDAGIEAEVDVLRREYSERLKVAQVFRDGCVFKDDRGYLEHRDAIIVNNYGVEHAVTQVLNYVDKWIKEIEGDRKPTRLTPRVSKKST